MAVNSRNSMELLLPKKWNDKSDNILDATDIITDGSNTTVSVVYYLSRNGHLEHPHFIEVPLSSSHGLYLKDVMNRLNILRGNGMPHMYSWSSKRSYKHGYVWQDLSENDLIKPTDGNDYILKGSEMLQSALNCRPHRPENLQNGSHDDINKTRRKKHQSWSSFENSTDYQNEYRVYKCESSRELGGKSADMATQTEEKEGRSRSLRETYRSRAVELSREELSPPPSMSSSEGPDGTSGPGDIDRATETDRTSRTGKASRVLIHLMTCGSKLSQIHEVVHL